MVPLFLDDGGKRHVEEGFLLTYISLHMWACAEDGFTSENQGTGSTLGTIFNMTNSALGAGILAFPYAFSKVWSCVVALLRCCVVVLLCCCVVLSVC